MADLDPAELAAVLPENVAEYLGATGWRTESTHEAASIWDRDVEGARAQVLVPTTAEFDDYPIRIADILRTLAVVESRSREEILHEFRYPMLDLQYIRMRPPAPSGTTLLHHGYIATRGVHDLFLSAATAVVLRAPQPVLPRSKPRAARNFLELVRLRTSGQGSYVLRVETALDVPTQLAQVVSPRAVLLHLYDALRAAHNTAEEARHAQDVGVFEQRVDNGISANLCEALADIGGPSNGPVDFHFTWAKPRPVTQPTPDLAFSGDHVVILRQAGRHLRNLTTTDLATIQGTVVELRRRSRRTPGKAVIEGMLNLRGQAPSEQPILVTLPDEFYARALQAHRDERQVLMVGTLRTTRHRPELVDVSDFRVL